MFKKLSVIAIGLICLSGNAMAQDASAVIANAQKALGDVKSITYSGSAKDVSFQQCGSNAADMNCRGTHDPMRPIAIGRKNWIHVGSPQAGPKIAAILSVVESCRRLNSERFERCRAP